MTQQEKLPADLHEAIYQRIAAHYLPRSQPQVAPVAIITGGQPGSGKSGITNLAKAELGAQGGFVLVDADKVRTRHPHYARLMREDDTTAANRTHPDAGAWAARLGRDAVASKRNVIFDQTSKDPDALVALAHRLRGAGYRVELRVMAVNRQVSEQRIHMRYETQKAATGHGRFSTMDNHEVAFSGVLQAVQAVERANAVDAIRIYDKDHRAIYDAVYKAGQWSREPLGAATMNAERTRPLALAERAELAGNYERILAMLREPGREAAPHEITGAERLAEIAKRQFLGQALRENQDHPGLTQAKIVLQRMAEQADAAGIRGAARDQVLAVGREILAMSLERGEPLDRVSRAYLAKGIARPGPEREGRARPTGRDDPER